MPPELGVGSCLARCSGSRREPCGRESAGAALIAVALLSLIADALTGWSLGRRLTPERASQNVVSVSGDSGSGADGDQRVRLIITANYDAGRTGLVYRDRLRRAAAWLARVTGLIGPGWQGWLAIAFVWLLVIAVLRLDGHKSTGIGVAQLVPTVGLVLSLALLLELASAGFSPAANDNASGVAAAIALVRALDVAPPRRPAVDLLLQGAGDGGAIGLRRYLQARGKRRRPSNTVVIGFAACAGGDPRWWFSDGPLVPVGLQGAAQAVCGRRPGRAALRGPGTPRAGHHPRAAGPSQKAFGDRDRLSRRAWSRPPLASGRRHPRGNRSGGDRPDCPVRAAARRRDRRVHRRPYGGQAGPGGGIATASLAGPAATSKRATPA